MQEEPQDSRPSKKKSFLGQSNYLQPLQHLDLLSPIFSNLAATIAGNYLVTIAM